MALEVPTEGTLVSNLSRQRFDQERWEEIQRRRFNRRREPGYTGAGFWYFNYPNMVGALGAGNIIQSQQEGAGAADMANGVSDTSFGGGMP